MSRACVAVLLFAACGSHATKPTTPPTSGSPTGTLTCAQIVETCDSTCTDPLCLHGCTSNGAPEAQHQHDALLSCGEHHGCTDEACIRASCASEADACHGQPAPTGPANPPPAAPDPAPSTT